MSEFNNESRGGKKKRAKVGIKKNKEVRILAAECTNNSHV